MVVRAGFGALAEVGEQAADSVGEGVVPFDLAGPAALDGVLGKLLLAGKPGAQARGVLAGGEELRATEVEIALAGSLGGCPQTVAKSEFGLEEVALEPVEGVLANLGPPIQAVPATDDREWPCTGTRRSRGRGLRGSCSQGLVLTD
ncbi:hypothetical protein [Streptomyces sp. NPDC005969]|uniref:hypothetical protein n=1 Tax=Streptomyces sp. NPDC005969 TaxID=3156722 RepID=UPI0033CC097A